MGSPRSKYVQEGQEGVYHCFSRCVVDAAPLFEKEGDTGFEALFSYFHPPGWFHRSGAGAGFAAHNHTIDRGEVDFTEALEQRFKGDEPEAGRNLAQRTDPLQISPSLHARPLSCDSLHFPPRNQPVLV